MDKLIKKCIEHFFKDRYNIVLEVTKIVLSDEFDRYYNVDYSQRVYRDDGSHKWTNLKSMDVSMKLIEPYLRSHKLSRIKNKLS